MNYKITDYIIGILLFLSSANYCSAQSITSMDGESIEWQRTIYREISSKTLNNAGLFYKTQNGTFFSQLFGLVLEGIIPAYNYGLNEVLTWQDDNRANLDDLLYNYDISYEEDEDSLELKKDFLDLPIKSYYILESTYYDLRNSSFHTRVVAVCPVMYKEDDIEGLTKYPMFWVSYKDIKSHMENILVYGDMDNTADMMTVSDFFEGRFYKGNVFKVFNMGDNYLADYCNSEEEILAEMQRMEQNLEEIRENTFNVDLKHKKQERMEGEKISDVIIHPSDSINNSENTNIARSQAKRTRKQKNK